MRLTIGSLPVGSRTNDEKLLDQLQELGERLDEESESLLPAVPPAASEDGEEPSGRKDMPFGVVYARDLDSDIAVGYLKYVPMGRLCRIEDLYVDAAFRRKCIGYSLMKAFYGICRKSGTFKISLGCIAANEGAMAFYRSEEFEASSAAYVLCHNESGKETCLPVQEREFSEDGFSRIWNKACGSLDRSIYLPEELEMLRQHYADGMEFKPVSICTVGGIECAVFARRTDAELYVPAVGVNPQDLNKELLDGLAGALLQYAEEKRMQACVTDIHLPLDLDRISSCWKKAGCTLYRMGSSLKPKKSSLKV